MITREEVIFSHIDNSNLNTRIDIAKNSAMLAREYEPILDMLGSGAQDLQGIKDDYHIENEAWKQEYANLDKALENSGYPPLSDQEKLDLRANADKFPPLDYKSAQDAIKNGNDAAFQLLLQITGSEDFSDLVAKIFSNLYDAASGQSLENFFNSIGEWWLGNIVPILNPDAGIDSAVNSNFDLALKTASPIVLDLDGDGIETFGANGQVLFDHDGDGNKHGSGWVKSDDGLLVLDRNGNGTIDSGLELFGENTLLADGSKARDGFEAMQAVDGNGDGKLDASDTVWADLRVWRDLNGDGISQGGELFTLEELGIKSINTGSDGKRQNLGNNNHIDGFSTFEWDESRGGGTGVSGDVYFENNQFYREFGDRIEIPAELAGIANMRGSGAVRDLREAAATSNSLREVLAHYSQSSSRLEQKNLLENLIHTWAGSANFRTFDERVGDLGKGKVYNVEFVYSWDLADRIGSLVGGSSSSSSSSGGSGSGATAIGAEWIKKQVNRQQSSSRTKNCSRWFACSRCSITNISLTSSPPARTKKHELYPLHTRQVLKADQAPEPCLLVALTI